MARSFQKVHKHVNKKKGAVEALHENSRDAKRLRRAGARDDRVSRVQATLARGRDLFGMLCQYSIFLGNCKLIWSTVERVAHFQQNLPEELAPLSDSDMMELVQKYASLSRSPYAGPLTGMARYVYRSAPELEQLRSERRKGRPPTKREEALAQRTELDEKEFKTGFWMPDLSQMDVLKTLQVWNGEWGGLGAMKFIRMTSDGEKHPSKFPPKGLS